MAAGGDGLAAALVGEEEGKKGRVGEKGPARTQNIGLVAPARMARQGLSRQCMWRDREGHVIADAAQRWLGPPAWPPCRATCTGATEAICRAGKSDATKRATSCKQKPIRVEIKILLKKLKIKKIRHVTTFLN